MTNFGAVEKWSPCVHALVRIILGLLFLEHGTAKLLGFPPPTMAQPALLSLLGIQGVIEIVGGLLVAIGLWTRPVAFILAGDMAVAYFMVHFPKSFFPLLNGGEAAVLYCFLFLYLFFRGAGPWSLDDKMH